MHAVTLSCILACLLSLINIFSNTAFNAIISLFLVALMSTYIISIGCVLYRRILSGEDSLPKARWRMGRRVGCAVNLGALLYSAFAFFWCFWPNTTATDVADFNWGVFMFVGVCIVAVVMYAVQGRKTYVAPVLTVVAAE
jgi:choline transport protein